MKISKKKIEKNRKMLLDMINKIDAISNYCKDEFIVIKLAKFQQQLYKLSAAKECYISEIDHKIENIIDDILKIVVNDKNSDSTEKILHPSLSNLIELMDTRVTLEYLDK